MSGRVGRYTLIHRLGQGGVANVFLARRDGSNEACVLKLLRVEVEGDRHSMARFQREAQLASLLHHPNIARITDAQFEDGTFYIAMEHIRGHTIGELMRRLLTNGMLPSIGTVVFIGARALEGLAYAHELADPDGRALRLVHRDLSLRNIMVSYAGEVKIIDFGIARGGIGRYKTAPGIVLGTLRYMSPEQAMAAETDRRSDLYTLGVVLYEMLAGQRCVPAGSHSEIMRAVISDAPIPLTTLNPAIPTQLARVVMKALEQSPEKRFQSANAFRSALLEGNTLIEDAAGCSSQF